METRKIYLKKKKEEIITRVLLTDVSNVEVCKRKSDTHNNAQKHVLGSEGKKKRMKLNE